MTYRCASVSTPLLAYVEGVSFILCSNQPEMLQQVFLMFSHFFPCQPCPPVYLHTNCSAATPPLHPHSSWGHIRGEKQHWIFPVVPAGAAAVLMSCLLSLVRASTHVQLCVQQSGYKMLQIVALSTEHRAETSAIN